MGRPIDHTHDERLTSWLESANAPASDFPIQNLPFGVFRTGASRARIGIAIGDRILDLSALAEAGLLGGLDGSVSLACRAFALNELMALGVSAWRAVRHEVSGLLASGSPAATRVERCMIRAADATIELPARVGDYTDFYASIFHATNVGRVLRPDNPLLPNYKWLPVGYHGRASSIVPSGRPVRRPRGQRRTAEGEAPVFTPTEMLDYEVELAAWVGPGNDLGTPVPLARAEEHIFGLTLLNDWSARDVQSWEYQPLGPFLAKSFATTVSPWIVTLEALAPFRAPAPKREPSDPALLPHLSQGLDRERGGFEIAVEAWLHTTMMRARGIAPLQLSRANALALYWTFSQMLTHHTSNGCNLRPGDVLGSGTLSGPSAGTLGCLLEITRRGKEPISLPFGETRTFLADGDEVILRGYCERVGFRRIGLGECRGVVLPAGDS